VYDQADSSGFISKRAFVSARALVAPSARLYGPVRIEDSVIVDHGVTLGYPSPEEQGELRAQLADLEHLPPAVFDELVDDIVSTPTTVDTGSHIRSGTVVYSGSAIGRLVDIAHHVQIRERSTVGRGTRVITGTQIMAEVRIGRGCRVAGTLCSRSVIGNLSSVLGHLMHNYRVAVSGFAEESPRIGSGVLVGRESSVVGGVTVDDYSVVGAGAVLTRSAPLGTVWMRNPAVQTGVRSAAEIAVLVAQIAQLEAVL
jgi:UDP-3-O-[3-hydroxymyristoyl] glucosamine N-acyltransferase